MQSSSVKPPEYGGPDSGLDRTRAKLLPKISKPVGSPSKSMPPRSIPRRSFRDTWPGYRIPPANLVNIEPAVLAEEWNPTSKSATFLLLSEEDGHRVATDLRLHVHLVLNTVQGPELKESLIRTLRTATLSDLEDLLPRFVDPQLAESEPGDAANEQRRQDRAAHYLSVLKPLVGELRLPKPDICDVGCGDGNIAMGMWENHLRNGAVLYGCDSEDYRSDAAKGVLRFKKEGARTYLAGFDDNHFGALSTSVFFTPHRERICERGVGRYGARCCSGWENNYH